MFPITRRSAVGAIALIFALAACSSGGTPPSASEAHSSASVAPSATPVAGEAAEIAVATDTGGALTFDPAEITVTAGATVRLTFTNKATVPHNLTFDDPIDVATETVVDPGASQTIEFTAPEAGEYTYVCTLHPGMEGTLLVEAAG